MPGFTGDYVFTDKRLLTKILHDEFKDHAIKITDLKSTPACKKGDNFISQVQRLQITASNENENTQNFALNKDMILKINIEDNKSSILLTPILWKCEKFAYGNLIPKFEKLCNVSFKFPKYYYGDEDIILLEDLKAKGYYLADKKTGVDLEQAFVVMDKLAKFHSASFVMKQNNPKEYEDLMAHYEHPYSSEKCISSSIPFVEHHMKNATDLIKKSVHNPEKYESLLQHLHDLVCVKKISHFENHIHSPNPVFIHGDLWGNNMMFVDRDGIVDDVAFLDFQATRPGSAIKDILYFMYMSVQPAVRSKNFDEIVQRYFDRRNGYLKQWSKSGINVDEEYSLDKFKAEMWQFRYYGLMNAILSLPVIVFDGKDEKCDFFTFDKNNNQSKFRDRLLDIFDEFLERGNHTAFDD